MFREMRRKKQALPEEQCRRILEEGEYGVLALLGEGGYPYAVPLNYALCGGKLYFHCAREGHKIDAIRGCKKASFCVVSRADAVPEEYTTYFESAIAFGRAQRCEGAERVNGLRLLLEHTGLSDHSPERCADLPAVEVYRVECDRVTGKRCTPFKGKG